MLSRPFKFPQPLMVVCMSSLFLLGAASAMAEGTTLSWSDTGSMNSKRANHTGTSLTDGRVLATGGFDGPGITNLAEIYSPLDVSWIRTGGMKTPRAFHTAT